MAERVWQGLVGPLLSAAVAVGLLGASVHFASGWLEQKQQAFEAARSELAQAARRYRSASDNRAVYRQYAERFRTMMRRGWIGGQHRLSWIEALQTINRDLKLPVLRYEIGQRETVSLDGVAGASRLHLYRTPMRLEIGALHEYDVVELLRRLARKGDGLMALARCTMRVDAPIRLDPRATNVEATCALDWYTLHLERDGG